VPEKILEEVQVMDELTGKTEICKTELSPQGKLFNQIVSEIQERIEDRLKLL